MPRNSFRNLAFVARFVVLGLALAFLVALFAPEMVARLREAIGTPPAMQPQQQDPSPAAAVHPGDQAQSAAARSGPVSYAQAVTRASPAVVNIYANRETTVRRVYRIPDPLTQRLLGALALGPPMQRHDQNLGSGVIFTSDGYVLTNNHVISGADDIQVLLDGGRVAQAKVIGTDAETDLAVLKIDADHLPTIAVANQADITVGDVVLAIGNPVALGKTVTMGIVSATGRQLNMSAYEDFIQTDAAINAGNSGGALVNSLGELVGINTAVYPRTPSPGGGYQPGTEGIGFAIPVTTAKAVLDQIVKHGRVIRGWMGADYTDMPLNGGGTHQPGVTVIQVAPDGPAAQAGIRAGDRLLKMDGKDITSQMTLRNREAALAPGTTVHIEGDRNGQPFSADLTLAERPAPSTTGV